jgi:hypothetical protein
LTWRLRPSDRRPNGRLKAAKALGLDGPPQVPARADKVIGSSLAEPLPGTPEVYAADIDREESTWSKIIRQAGLKPQ